MNLLENLVSECKGNPIHNMLLLEAVGQKVNEIINNEEEYLEKWPEHHIICVEAYIRAAKDIDQILNNLTNNQ